MIMTLEIGNTITPLRHINATMVSYWQFAKECADILGGLMPGAELKIVELSKIPGAMWVRVELPGRLPVASLKIAGEEYGNNFRPL
ncbi:MAG: hypothetical protein EOP39_00375 [Rubrivivax sp.]|nr:MAG: hypothetical protein EOP39_00375 [Rubrivivax sp.]